MYSFKALKNQLIWGYSFIIQFWFQWDLIFLTIIFTIIIALASKNYLFFIQLFSIFSYILQYSGINKKFFIYLSGSKKQPLGRLDEVFSFAASGFTLASLEIINSLQKNKIKTLILCLLIFISLEIFHVFSKLKGGIAYPGIVLNVKSICLLFCFSLFPSEKISKSKISNIIKYITNYTAGEYYLHISIYNYFKLSFKFIKDGTLYGCFIIYMICYLICFIGIKLVGKNKLKYLFI